MFLLRRLLFHCILLVVCLFVLSLNKLWACACGCGIFDVGTAAILPTHQGGLAYVEYDVMNQNNNWSGSSRASAANNEDKEIRTQYYTAGIEYMFNRRWGTMLDIPLTDRRFETLNEDGDRVSFQHGALGDIRWRGIYSGFSPDLSSGVTFGIKFPSGESSYEHFDRDTSIGTGSTDLLVGGFYRGSITTNNSIAWFANTQADLPVLITPAYRPGSEINTVIGAYYNGLKIGAVKIAPVGQIIGSLRWSDTGEHAMHPDSGHQRVLVSPGFEFSSFNWRLYADVAFPLYEYVNGNQLVASRYYKLNISRGF